jgi:hypothetical protein
MLKDLYEKEKCVIKDSDEINVCVKNSDGKHKRVLPRARTKNIKVCRQGLGQKQTLCAIIGLGAVLAAGSYITAN